MAEKKITNNEIISAINKFAVNVDKRFEQADKRFDILEEQISDLREEVHQIQGEIKRIWNKLEEIEQKLDKLSKTAKEDADAIAVDILKLKQRVKFLEKKINLVNN
ncbi:MAG: hypothetical protein HYW71_00595 [Candidatus Niyogibacteria bacterium]|nr:hypothetical protein [Candidatus Niyogibacteria bacterium]